MANIVIKLTINESADPELHKYLTEVYPRRRAERIRQLAFNGLTEKIEQPLITKTAVEKPEQKSVLVLDDKENEPVNNVNVDILYDDMPDIF